ATHERTSGLMANTPTNEGGIMSTTEAPDFTWPEVDESSSIECWMCRWYRENDRLDHPSTGAPYGFTDTRTGRSFCFECMLALLTWEQDAAIDPDVRNDPDYDNYREAVSG